MNGLNKIKIAAALVATSICFLGMVPAVMAQEPPSSEVGSTSSLTGTIGVKDISWEELGSNDLKLNLNRPTTRYTLDVPGDVTFGPGSYLNLLVSHTGAQVEKPAALTLDINRNVVGTAQLTADNDDRSEIRFEILPEHLKTGRNDINVSLNTGGDRCNSTDLPVEAVLHKEGLIHLEYDIVPRDPDLRLYPVPFFERSFEPSVVYLVLPALPTPDDLTVAATISAGLGRYAATSGEIQVNSVTAAELTGDIQANYNLIVIGTPETNSVLSQLPLPLSLDQENIAPHQGVLQEIRSPWNPDRMILAVTGKSDEGVFKAGAALNRQILFPSLRGQVNVIEALLDPPSDEAGEFVVERTFEDMGYRDEVVYGTRANEERFTFNMPDSWQISEPPFLRLRFTHSEILSDTLSSLDVRLNNVPIGSTLLDQNNAKDGLLEVELPVWLLEGGRNEIQVFVDMALGGPDECSYWSSDQLWTVIGRNSTLRLAYEPQPEAVDLANLFKPLTDEPNLTDTFLALPSTLNQIERDRFLNLAVQLGRATRGNYISLTVGFVDELSDEIKRDYHIVTIGQPSINPLIREINDQLPLPFMNNSDEPSQIYNPAIIAFDSQRSIGFIQLLASPWNPEKAILVMTGTDSVGTTQALDVLVNGSEGLEGNLVIIENEDLVTFDTRPLLPNPGDQLLKSTAPDKSVRMAQAERWW